MITEPEPTVAVVGSYNHALTMTVAAIPNPGETVLGASFEEGVGGKGSNQAFAAARLGGENDVHRSGRERSVRGRRVRAVGRARRAHRG